MKKIKYIFLVLLIGIPFLMSTKSVLGLNQYSVNPGASFRWDATKYYFMKDGLGLGNDLSYTHHYFLEFNFTSWGGIPGAEYLNGTVNSNGTIFDGDMSHNLYYGWTPWGQEWVTDIIDYQHPTYPVHVYLICDTEIVQTTKPNLQDLADNSWLTFGEPSANNFTLTGTYIDGDETDTYTGNIKFNSDKVLSYVFDEIVSKDLGVVQYVERYTWTLTYIPGTPSNPSDDMIDPAITIRPNNFTVEYGYIGQSLSWTATDTNPNIYTIELQGTGVVMGPTIWSNGVANTYNIPNGLATGVYIYTINFTDDYDNFVTDSIAMTVKPPPPGIPGFELYLVFGFFTTATIGIIIRMRKKKY